jgi:hypothetical protein
MIGIVYPWVYLHLHYLCWFTPGGCSSYSNSNFRIKDWNLILRSVGKLCRGFSENFLIETLKGESCAFKRDILLTIIPMPY